MREYYNLSVTLLGNFEMYCSFFFLKERGKHLQKTCQLPLSPALSLKVT